MAGPPAAGKSTFGEALARALPAALVDKDLTTAPLVAAALQAAGRPAAALDDPWYRAHIRPAAYESVAQTVAQVIKVGVDVVLVAPYLDEVGDPGWLGHVGIAFGTDDVRIIWLTATPDTLRARMTARGAPRDRTKLRDWSRYAATLPQSSPACPHVLLDTSRASRAEIVVAAQDLARSWRSSTHATGI